MWPIGTRRGMMGFEIHQTLLSMISKGAGIKGTLGAGAITTGGLGAGGGGRTRLRRGTICAVVVPVLVQPDRSIDATNTKGAKRRSLTREHSSTSVAMLGTRQGGG